VLFSGNPLESQICALKAVCACFEEVINVFSVGLFSFCADI
jgi:hypothetical protein